MLNDAFGSLAADLARVDQFYDSIGGLPGYQLQCLELLAQQSQHLPGGGGGGTGGAEQRDVEFLVPPGLDLSSPGQAAAAAAATAAGIAALPHMAEIYPLGGAGDRLGLCCEETGDSLPAAVLPYCGRTLLASLVRDLQAREYLFFRLHARQLTTPVAVMTSAAKGNHARVRALFGAAGWFGRGAAAFRLFQQPLVPVVAAAGGEWLLGAPLRPMMKPGGHGVLWKLLLDEGGFGWLARAGRTAAVVRQISNPMAGQDTTLLALAGEGFRAGRAFGFASCERVVGAAEGMNVLLRERRRPGASSSEGEAAPAPTYRVTNVEYTEFARLGIRDRAAADGSPRSLFPANTNVLYVGLPQVEAAVREGVAEGSTAAVLPGMILNTTKEACFSDAATRRERRVAAGRLECTMQNLADCFGAPLAAPPADAAAAAALPTFLVYAPRRKVTSSAKRQRAPGSNQVHQTPDGSFLDLLRNAADVLARCGVAAPLVPGVDEFLAAGPPFLFFYHPALGPLWEVVAQKLRGGSVAAGAEVQLEVAEADVAGLHVEGSLLVLADAVMGHTEVRPAAAAGGAGDAGGDAGPRGGGGGGGAPSSADDGDGDGEDAPCVDALEAAALAAGGEPRLVYSARCGRVRLRNVSVRNRGVDWAAAGNVYWRHRVARHEACRIVLHGAAEFEAVDVELAGELRFEVPDGHRMRVAAGPGGAPVATLEAVAAPSWWWEYAMRADHGVGLTMREG